MQNPSPFSSSGLPSVTVPPPLTTFGLPATVPPPLILPGPSSSGPPLSSITLPPSIVLPEPVTLPPSITLPETVTLPPSITLPETVTLPPPVTLPGSTVGGSLDRGDQSPAPTLPGHIKPIILRPWQRDWAQRVYQILLRNHGYVDTSRMGSGKTYVTLWEAQQFGFPLLIICPVIMIEVWRKVTAEYNVPVIDTISYQSLRSKTGYQPKHGFLTRTDTRTERGTKHTFFTPTPYYLQLVQHGIMVVCDEIHYIKNNSSQYKACNALIQPIISTGGMARFALLSGTPFDKPESALNLLRLIGYIRSSRLYTTDRGTKQIHLEGIQELIDACRSIDATTTDSLISMYPPTKQTINALAYYLYTQVVKRNISGAMPSPIIAATLDIKNGFFNSSPAGRAQLHQALRLLARATAWKKETENLELVASNFGELTQALMYVEYSKIEIFYRLAVTILMSNPNNKVIISVNYHQTVDALTQALAPYHPLILTGKVAAKDRGSIVAAFNTDPNRRLLIMNTAVAVGISLHDTVGNSPRFMLISPSYRMIDISQATYRIYRDGSMSNAIIRLVYGNFDDIREEKILNALAEKSEVLKGTLEVGMDPSLILPGDYPGEMEPPN